MISLNVPLRIGKCTPGGTCTPNDSMVSQKSLSQKMAHWVGAQCQVTFAKNAQTFPIYDVTPEKPKPKPIFLKIRTTRPTESVEGLNSSLAQSTGEVWCCKALHQGWGTYGPLWPVSESSLPKLQYNIVSKPSSMVSRYLDSESREVTLPHT